MLKNLISSKSGLANSAKCRYSSKYRTGIVMANMGGPEKRDDVYDFLFRLFSDRQLIRIPFQSVIAPWIAKRRTPKIQKQYDEIGGGSPITKWTHVQGRGMVEILDQISPETAPHNYYIGFSYVKPLMQDAIQAMKDDGIERAVVFSQYPQYSCTTSGSSFNTMAKLLSSPASSASSTPTTNELPFQLSIIDRWPAQPHLVKAFAEHIRAEMTRVPAELRAQTVLLFSAHSIPLSTVDRGDPYPQEVAATVHHVMQELGWQWPYRLVWQSKVGPSRWLGQSTEAALKGLGRQKCRSVMLVPVAFTSDHIETLYEMDLEYCGEVAGEAGIPHVFRAAAMNDNPVFVQGLATLVKQHLRSGSVCSNQFYLRCPGCVNAECARARGFVRSLAKTLPAWNSLTFPADKQVQSQSQS